MPPLHAPDPEPLWREEVPIFEADERYVSRRQLTKFLTLTSLGMFIGNLWIAFRSWLHRAPSYPVCSVAQLDELPLGGVKIFQYPTRNDDCILVHRSDDEYVAYSQKWHAPFVCRLLRAGDRPAGLPLSPGLLLGAGWLRAAGSAAAAVAARDPETAGPGADSAGNPAR